LVTTALRDFADGHTPALHVAPEGAVRLDEFSKWLGLAGLRIGALVAHRLVEELAQTSTSVLGASVVASARRRPGSPSRANG